MPRSFTKLVVSVLLLHIFNFCETELSVLLRKMTGSLSGLAITRLLLNHSIAFRGIEIDHLDIYLGVYALNNIGPKIEP